jgi:hypothetical protein
MNATIPVGHIHLFLPYNLQKPFWFSTNIILEPGYFSRLSYGLNGRGPVLSRGKRFLSAPQCPDQFWGPPSLLSMGTEGSFPGCKASGT